MTSLFFSDTSKPRPQRRLNVTLLGRKRKGELRRPPGLVVRCAERRRRKLSRGLRRRAPPGRWSVPAGSEGRTGRGSSRLAPDRRGRTPRYLLPRAWSQYYRSSDVEGAEESPEPDPPRRAGGVGESWDALAGQKLHRPKDGRAHEEGDRRSRYRSPDRPRNSLLTANCIGTATPARMASSRNKACTSLLLSLSRFTARVALPSTLPCPAPPRAAVYRLRFGHGGGRLYRASRQAR